MIVVFDGEYDFLSNFYPSPFEYNGIIFPTVENWFQAWKTEDPIEFEKIATAKTPGLSKRLGRHCDLRSDWEKIKIDVMREGLRYKFKNPELRNRLIMTGNEELIEGNWWHDNTWGNCMCQMCQNIPGRNMLGILLMEIRQEILYEENA